jgi:hypothetical protein
MNTVWMIVGGWNDWCLRFGRSYTFWSLEGIRVESVVG